MMTLSPTRRPTDELIAEVGDDVLIGGTFSDDATGNPVNPAGGVSVRIVGPATYVLWEFGTDAQLQNPTVGYFACVWKTPGPGRFYWRLYGEDLGTSPIGRAHVGTILVQADPTDVTPPPAP